MSDNLIVLSFAVMRALYSATVEAFVTWGFNLMLVSIIPTVPGISYLWHYICWFIIGTIVASIQYKEVIK